MEIKTSIVDLPHNDREIFFELMSLGIRRLHDLNRGMNNLKIVCWATGGCCICNGFDNVENPDLINFGANTDGFLNYVKENLITIQP